MPRFRKTAAVVSLIALLGGALVAPSSFARDKPIYVVTYYTDGTPDGTVYGFEIQYCDGTTYREGSLTLWPQFDYRNECDA